MGGKGEKTAIGQPKKGARFNQEPSAKPSQFKGEDSHKIIMKSGMLLKTRF